MTKQIKTNKQTRQTAKINKNEKAYSLNAWWYFNSSILSCWRLRISLNDLFRLKKYNWDINWCISLIAKKTSINWLYLEKEDWTILDKNKYKLEYSYLSQLFSSQTFNFWKNTFFTQTTIAWENYIEPLRNINWKIVKFWNIDSRTMVKLIDENTEDIVWFRQYWKDWKSQDFKIDEIGYFMYQQDVENENLSMWLLDWIIFDILWDLEASKTNYYFFQNDAIPWAVFMLDKAMSKDQLELATEQIKNKFSGSENKYKFLISNWVTDVKTLVMSHTDMDFLNQRKFTVDKVSATFWCPKELLWYVTDSWSYSKIKEITKEFINSTIAEYENYLESCINILISSYWNELLIDLSKYKVRCDSETFDDRNVIEENQRKDIATWIITINEAREERWLELFTNQEFTNLSLIPRNLTTEIVNNTNTNTNTNTNVDNTNNTNNTN